MKLDKIRTVEEILERFMNKHKEEGQVLFIKFLKNGKKIKKVIVSIEKIETMNIYDLKVTCIDINNEHVVFGFTRKSNKNEDEKIKNLSIERRKDGKLIFNEY